LIPANCKIFFEAGAATKPVPLGAGISLILTDPDFPVTFIGTVWALPILFPQYPVLTGIKFNLAWMMASLMAPCTSLAHFHPKPK